MRSVTTESCLKIHEKEKGNELSGFFFQMKNFDIEYLSLLVLRVVGHFLAYP